MSEEKAWHLVALANSRSPQQSNYIPGNQVVGSSGADPGEHFPKVVFGPVCSDSFPFQVLLGGVPVFIWNCIPHD
jgi:hypothetical protein